MPETKTIFSKFGKCLHILFIDYSKTKTRVSFLTNKEVKIVFVSNPWHPKSVVLFPVFCWHLDRVLPCHDDFFWNPDRVFPFSADPCNENKGGGKQKVNQQKSEPLLSKENKKTEKDRKKDRKRQKKTEKDRKRQKKDRKRTQMNRRCEGKLVHRKRTSERRREKEEEREKKKEG